MRNVILFLLIMGLVSCVTSRVTRWTKMSDLTPNNRTAWENQLKQLVRYPSNQIPSEDGVWVDNGYGWQGSYSDSVPVLFCSPEFRVVHVGSHGAPWVLKEGGVEIFSESEFSLTSVDSANHPVERKVFNRTVVGKISPLAQLTSDKAKVFQVIMQKRSKTGLYWVEDGSGIGFIYVDPKMSFNLFNRGEKLDGTVSIYDGDGKLLEQHPDMFQKELGIRLDKSMKKFSVEWKMDGSTTLFNHWATVMDYSYPILIDAQGEVGVPTSSWNLTQADVIYGTTPPSPWANCYREGWVQVNIARSTNLSAWVDVTIDLDASTPTGIIPVGIAFVTITVPCDSTSTIGR